MITLLLCLSWFKLINTKKHDLCALSGCFYFAIVHLYLPVLSCVQTFGWKQQVHLDRQTILLEPVVLKSVDKRQVSATREGVSEKRTQT